MPKRHIGVITPHETRHRKYLEELSRVIAVSWNVVPHTRFYDVSYERVLEVSRSGAAYDVVVAARMSDQNHPQVHNAYAAARELRRLNKKTILVITFNELVARVRGHDVEAEKARLDKFFAPAETPGAGPVPGVALTSSLDPLFLISILGDILSGPSKYLDQQQVHQIESQAHFLNHPPEHTLIGIRP